MIKIIVNWMRKKRQLSGKGKAPSSSKNAVPAKIIPKQQHGINPDAFNKNAVQAVEKIRRGGYVAYIVGGAVRDLLLGVSPKDFDIATDATPAQVRRLFRNSRIIGRRFRIVHLYFHHDNEAKIMEVSTFRAGDDSVCEESGRVLRDNYFGDAASDAWRRDFCVNALFYNPHTGDILDYVGGYADVSRRRLRVIGKPAVRFRQDPVRVLRALRISAKLNLSMAGVTQRALIKYSPLLVDIASSRLFDEFIKTVKSSACAKIFDEWRRVSAAQFIFPSLTVADNFVQSVVQETDRRFKAGKEISVSFVIAAIFWPSVAAHFLKLMKAGERSVFAMEKSMEYFPAVAMVPKRIVSRIQDLFFLQARMSAMPAKRRAATIIRHPLFKRAVAFAAARQDEGATLMASWWRDYAASDDEARDKMIAKSNPAAKRRSCQTD